MSPILRLLVGTNHGLVVMDTRNNVVTQVMATDSKLLSVCVCVCVCVSVMGSSTKFSGSSTNQTPITITSASAFFKPLSKILHKHKCSKHHILSRTEL